MDFPLLIPRITIKDIVEIFVIAFFIYQLFLLIKGTRAMQILQGLGVLLVSLWLCDLFGLRTLSWLLNSVMVMIVVAIPIVFQPEIRRALGQIGRGGILSLFSSGEEEFCITVEEIVDACFHMSKKKIGAIIVIERDIGLEEFMETGTKLYSEITSRLIQTVFFPNSPLHDGAVIIKDGKIDSAGCYLPLTESLEIDKDLGTRHRAAIGITEHTDSVAIVVSEESGKVSICNGGRLKYDLTMKSLERHLRSLCGPKRKMEKLLLSFPFNIKSKLGLDPVVKKKKSVLISSRDTGKLDTEKLRSDGLEKEDFFEENDKISGEDEIENGSDKLEVFDKIKEKRDSFKNYEYMEDGKNISSDKDTIMLSSQLVNITEKN